MMELAERLPARRALLRPGPRALRARGGALPRERARGRCSRDRRELARRRRSPLPRADRQRAAARLRGLDPRHLHLHRPRRALRAARGRARTPSTGPGALLAELHARPPREATLGRPRLPRGALGDAHRGRPRPQRGAGPLHAEPQLPLRARTGRSTRPRRELRALGERHGAEVELTDLLAGLSGLRRTTRSSRRLRRPHGRGGRAEAGLDRRGAARRARHPGGELRPGRDRRRRTSAASGWRSRRSPPATGSTRASSRSPCRDRPGARPRAPRVAGGPAARAGGAAGAPRRRRAARGGARTAPPSGRRPAAMARRSRTSGRRPTATTTSRTRRACSSRRGAARRSTRPGAGGRRRCSAAR